MPFSNDWRAQQDHWRTRTQRAWDRVPKPFWTAHAWAAGLGTPLAHKGKLEGNGPVLLVLPDGRTAFLSPTPKGMAVSPGGVWVPQHRAFWDCVTRHIRPSPGIVLAWAMLESEGGSAHTRLARLALDTSPARVVALQGFAGAADIAAPTWTARVEWSFGSTLRVGLSTAPWPAIVSADPHDLCGIGEQPTPLVEGITGGILRMGGPQIPLFQGFALDISHRFWWRVGSAFDATRPLASTLSTLAAPLVARKGLPFWLRDRAPLWMGPTPGWTAHDVEAP